MVKLQKDFLISLKVIDGIIFQVKFHMHKFCVFLP